MQNNFRKFEELVFFDSWISDSSFRFRILVSGFWVSGLSIYYKIGQDPAVALRGKVVWITGASSGIREYLAYAPVTGNPHLGETGGIRQLKGKKEEKAPPYGGKFLV